MLACHGPRTGHIILDLETEPGLISPQISYVVDLY